MDRQMFLKSLLCLPFISFNEQGYIKGEKIFVNENDYLEDRPMKTVKCKIMYERPCVLKYVQGEWFLIAEYENM